MNKTEKVIVPFCSLTVCLCLACCVPFLSSRLKKEDLTTCKNGHDDKDNQIRNIFAVNKVFADGLEGDMIKVREILSGTGKGNNIDIREETLNLSGDCVYLMRDSRRTPDGHPVRQSYRLLSHINREKLDIFRIEKLWKNEKEERFAFGHHYFRPHETHHSPSRKFYHNELFRVPLYEIIPLEAVVGTCCVLDLYTYCKGRPKGVKEQDVYICDYRLDKSAHLFYKIHRNRYPVCTKPYAFDHFPKKLTPKRDFSPHYVPDNYKRNGGRSSWKTDRSKPQIKDLNQEEDSLPPIEDVLGNQDQASSEMPSLEEPEKEAVSGETCESDKKVEEGNSDTRQLCTPEERRHVQRERLNQILLNLLEKIPGKNAIDVTYLLEEGSGRKLRRRTLTIPESGFRK